MPTISQNTNKAYQIMFWQLTEEDGEESGVMPMPLPFYSYADAVAFVEGQRDGELHVEIGEHLTQQRDWWIEAVA